MKKKGTRDKEFQREVTEIKKELVGVKETP